MAKTFDEAQNLLLEQDLDDEVAPLVIYEMSVLKDTYAPTIKMTKAQYDVFKGALDYSSEEGVNDFIYFIDNLDTQSHFYGDIFSKELSAFRNDSRYFMQTWLHPECIKVVD